MLMPAKHPIVMIPAIDRFRSIARPLGNAVVKTKSQIYSEKGYRGFGDSYYSFDEDPVIDFSSGLSMAPGTDLSATSGAGTMTAPETPWYESAFNWASGAVKTVSPIATTARQTLSTARQATQTSGATGILSTFFPALQAGPSTTSAKVKTGMSLTVPLLIAGGAFLLWKKKRKKA